MRLLFLLPLLIVKFTACDSSSPTKTPDSTSNDITFVAGTNEAPHSTTPSGLGYLFLHTTDARRPQPGEAIAVHYSGALADSTIFDSSWERNDPFYFTLGRGLVIKGWEEGIALMPLGSQIRLFIPPDLAYGRRGVAGVIPANATLIFDVELLSIYTSTPSAPTAVTPAQLTTITSGLQYIDFTIGIGPSPQLGQEVRIHFTAWLTNGRQIQTTLDEGQPFSFAFGKAPISGWDEGIATMQRGGKRQLIIPPDLAFGTAGSGTIPPNATLIIEMELLEIY